MDQPTNPVVLLIGLGVRCSFAARSASRHLLPPHTTRVLGLVPHPANDDELDEDPVTGSDLLLEQLIADSTSQAIVGVASIADPRLPSWVPRLSAASARFMAQFAFVLHAPLPKPPLDTRLAAVRADHTYVVQGATACLQRVIADVAFHWLRYRLYPEKLSSDHHKQ